MEKEMRSIMGGYVMVGVWRGPRGPEVDVPFPVAFKYGGHEGALSMEQALELAEALIEVRAVIRDALIEKGRAP